MKIVTRGLAALGFSLLTLAPAAAETGAGVALRYKFNAGEKLHYVMEQKQKMQIDAGGQTFPVEISQTTEMAWQVESVDAAGKAHIKQHIDRIRFAMDGPTGKEEYDSQGGKSTGTMIKTMAPVFDAMAGAEITLTIDSSGHIADFQMPQKVSAAVKALPNGGAMSEMFSGDQLKRMSGAIVLPTAAVSKGASWSDKKETKMPFGKMIVETVFTLDGPAPYEGKAAEKIAMKPKIAIEPAAGGPVTVKLKEHDGHGTAYFDRKAGRLLASEEAQTMKMDLTVGGTNITQSLDQKTSLKLQEK